MLLEKLKALGLSDSLDASAPTAPPGKPPTRQSILQNRSQFGVNLGSMFVQESFIFGKFFPDGSNTEFSGVSAYIKQHGAEQTRKDLEQHWNSFVSDEDWKWLQSVGVTAVRVPIGYWHVNGGYYTKDTPFEKIASVYKNAWDILKNVIQKADQYDIGVLVDVHALPGGANCSEHSGVENKRAEFWDSSKHQKHALAMLEFIADDLKKCGNLVGLQIVNESEFSKDGQAQKAYYSKAVKKIRSVNSNLPVVISDGWWTDQWVQWLQSQEKNMPGGAGSAGIVIDTHVYRCFSDDDKKKSPEQIIQDLEKDMVTNLSGPADVMVGEYSCVLDGQSWDKARGDRGDLVRRYGQQEQRLMRERTKAGYYFWTLKFEHGDGGEWGFVPQVKSGALAKRNTQARLPDQKQAEEVLERELGAHSSYWDKANPREKYEHWRFKEGFITGWADAQEFAKLQGSKIGRVNAWRSSRLTEHRKHRGDSGFLWEWEQGFSKALEVFAQTAGL